MGGTDYVLNNVIAVGSNRSTFNDYLSATMSVFKKIFGDVDSMLGTIQKFINLDKKCKTNIINNARETIRHNHLLSHQIDQFKIFYSKVYKNYE